MSDFDEVVITTTTREVRRTSSGETAHVSLLIDESGSMLGVKDATLSGVNEYVDSLRNKGAKDNIAYRVTLSFFNHARGCRVIYADKPIGEVKHVTPAEYQPDDYTPLRDAVGTTVTRMASAITAPTKVLFVVQTDGMENRSSEFTPAAIQALVKAKEAEGWTFVFLGADLSQTQSVHAATMMGMSAGNTQSYVKSATRGTFQNMADASHSHTQAASVGSASTDFFKEQKDAFKSKDQS